MRQVRWGLDRPKVCVSQKENCRRCSRSPTKAALKQNMVHYKSTNDIQMVPKISSQLCLGEWQVQQKHVEFFTQTHCVPTLTPSWALSALPESCLVSAGLRWLCQQTWPCSEMFFLLSHPVHPPTPTHAKVSNRWGDRKLKQLKSAFRADCFVDLVSRWGEFLCLNSLFGLLENSGLIQALLLQGLLEITRISHKKTLNYMQVTSNNGWSTRLKTDHHHERLGIDLGFIENTFKAQFRFLFKQEKFITTYTIFNL